MQRRSDRTAYRSGWQPQNTDTGGTGGLRKGTVERGEGQAASMSKFKASDLFAMAGDQHVLTLLDEVQGMPKSVFGFKSPNSAILNLQTKPA
jgi:hypothetical protein